MKKYFEDYTIAVTFVAICAAIAAVMGLVEARDKKHGKRRPFPPTKILIYTAEWIRRITNHITTPFRRRYDHLVRFEDGMRRLSPEMVVAVKKAPIYTPEQLEDICNPSSKISTELDPILI